MYKLQVVCKHHESYKQLGRFRLLQHKLNVDSLIHHILRYMCIDLGCYMHHVQNKHLLDWMQLRYKLDFHIRFQSIQSCNYKCLVQYIHCFLLIHHMQLYRLTPFRDKLAIHNEIHHIQLRNQNIHQVLHKNLFQNRLLQFG